MPYAFGQANDMPSLLAALKTACVDGGWSVNSGTVLSSGDCHVNLIIHADYIEAAAGLGFTAGALVDPAPGSVRLMNVTDGQLFDWPVKWTAHVFDDEAYFFVNYGADRYAYVAFGQSPVPSLPGKGVWISGYPDDVPLDGVSYDSTPPYGALQQRGNFFASTGPFFCRQASSPTNSFLHHGLDGGGWSDATGDTVISANRTAGYLLASQPSAWNGEAVLLPMQPMMNRPANKRSIVADLSNARYIRIDSMDPETIITLGPDRWKVYPFYRKNAAVPNGDTQADHSGTFAWAIRYEGD
jgi:hypothetical protein